MKLKYVYVAALLTFAGIFVSQSPLKIYGQSSQLIDSQTGKPIDRKNLPRFIVDGGTDGIINKTNIKFYSVLIETNDEQKITKNIYYSDNKLSVKKYFNIFIVEPRKIIERGKTKNKDLTTSERILSEVKTKDGKFYEIIIYKSGKSFVSIIAKKLELLLECEKWLNIQK